MAGGMPESGEAESACFDGPLASSSGERPNSFSCFSKTGERGGGEREGNFGNEMLRDGPPCPLLAAVASIVLALACNSKKVVSDNSASISPMSTSSRSESERVSCGSATAPRSIMRASATVSENDGRSPPSSSLSASGTAPAPYCTLRDDDRFRPADSRSAIELKPRTPNWRPYWPRRALLPDSCNSATRLRQPN